MNLTFQEQREQLEKEQQAYFGKLEEVQKQLNELESSKKVEVDRLPNGFMLGVKHDNDNTRRQVFLTDKETNDLVKDILNGGLPFEGMLPFPAFKEELDGLMSDFKKFLK